MYTELGIITVSTNNLSIPRILGTLFKITSMAFEDNRLLYCNLELRYVFFVPLSIRTCCATMGTFFPRRGYRYLQLVSDKCYNVLLILRLCSVVYTGWKEL